MTVYVEDESRERYSLFGKMRAARMAADTEAELHEMARKIGISRRYFHIDHYELSPGKRLVALQFGAVRAVMKIVPLARSC